MKTTEADRARLADFDARSTTWGFYDNETGWPRIHSDALFLRRLLRESEAERERRQTELIEANNREVERRRTAEARSDKACEMIAEAYKVIGALSYYTGTFDHPDVQRALDKFATGPDEPAPDAELLPWPKTPIVSDAVEVLRDLLAHNYAEECQECGIGRSEAWGAAKTIIAAAES